MVNIRIILEYGRSNILIMRACQTAGAQQKVELTESSAQLSPCFDADKRAQLMSPKSIPSSAKSTNHAVHSERLTRKELRSNSDRTVHFVLSPIKGRKHRFIIL